MKQPEEVQRDLVSLWLTKADQDLDAAVHLLDAGDRFREVIAFHCQQAVEKYLKTVLVRYRIAFPKTHDIAKLLGLVELIRPGTAAQLRDIDVLTPFGTEARYPSDTPELLPGEASVLIEVARKTRDVLIPLLASTCRA